MGEKSCANCAEIWCKDMLLTKHPDDKRLPNGFHCSDWKPRPESRFGTRPNLPEVEKNG